MYVLSQAKLFPYSEKVRRRRYPRLGAVGYTDYRPADLNGSLNKCFEHLLVFISIVYRICKGLCGFMC